MGTRVTKQIALGHRKFALVDDEDHWFLIQWEWYLSPQGYAVRGKHVNGKYTKIQMHRVILERKLGHNDFEVAHHVNEDEIDNHKNNLQAVTRQRHRQIHNKNKNNSSKYFGVSWHEQNKKWKAQICVDRKQMFLGYFDDEIMAARAYDRAAIKYRGEYICLNFSRSDYPMILGSNELVKRF